MTDYLSWLKEVESEIVLALKKIDEAFIETLYTFPQMQKDEVEANKEEVKNKLNGLCENLNNAWKQARNFWRRKGYVNKEYRIDISNNATTLSADLEIAKNEAGKEKTYIENALNNFPVVLREELTANVYTKLGVLLKLVREMITKLKEATE